MMENRHDAESASHELDTPESLQVQLDGLAVELDLLVRKVKELRATEDTAAGKCFAAEIFKAQTAKLAKETEMIMVRNRIKRMRMALDDERLFAAHEAKRRPDVC